MIRRQVLALALWLAGVSGIAGTALAYCPWEGAPDCSPGTAPFSMCDRNIASGRSCQAPVNNGAGTVCNPAVANMTVFIFSATQTNTNMTIRSAAFCSWQCTTTAPPPPTTATCRIDLLDGLPIELMGFSVGGDEPAGDDHRDGEAEAESENP